MLLFHEYAFKVRCFIDPPTLVTLSLCKHVALQYHHFTFSFGGFISITAARGLCHLNTSFC